MAFYTTALGKNILLHHDVGNLKKGSNLVCRSPNYRYKLLLVITWITNNKTLWWVNKRNVEQLTV